MHHNVALDASDLGTGKTICACETARRLGKDLIVIGKKIMKPVWAYWMDQWGVDGIVGNWEMARKRGLPSIDGALYCFDEVHEAGGYKTLNAKLLINVYEQGRPLLMLSATAIESPLKMWALGYILGFHNLKDFYAWGFKNGVRRNYNYPGFHFNNSHGYLARIHEHIFPAYGSRMRKNEIPDFPECQTIVEMVDCSESEKDPLLKLYFDQIRIRELESELKREEKAAKSETPWLNTGGDVLPEILYARMRAELSKVPVLIELALAGLSEGHSVVIFCNFLPTIKALTSIRTDLADAEIISGAQDITERNEVLDRFQKDKTRVIISTIDSGGAGISLHDVTGKHPRLALLCPTWRATTFRQAIGRVWRAGAKTKAIQMLVYSAGSIEERVAERVRAKLGQIDQINDADLAEEEFVAV